MYKSKLGLIETESAITIVRDGFTKELREKLNLKRVSTPLFLESSTGLNDNLNGTEEAVGFEFKEKRIEIVHSLAKWKRYALTRYGFNTNEGIYTNMNAIRKDEELDYIHSIYVDQWDWEKVIDKEDRTIEYLKKIVKNIYDCIKKTSEMVIKEFPNIKNRLKEDIYFITTQDLEDMYPLLTPSEREDKITKKHGSVFLMQIGDLLNSGIKHDGRSPDYDDWNLNGDILVYNDIADCSFELSSMGIRVDEEGLINQCRKANALDRLDKPFHKSIISKELKYTVGGGIGQSRLCMFLLEKAHIGEVQCSYWPDDILKDCKDKNIFIL